MSEHEALMWNIEKDPLLNPSGGSVMILDQAIDVEQFRRQMRNGIGQLRMAELYQQTTRDEPAPPDIDLAATIAEAGCWDRCQHHCDVVRRCFQHRHFLRPGCNHRPAGFRNDIVESFAAFAALV